MLLGNTNSAGGQDNDDDDDFEDIPSQNNDLTLPASLHPRSRMSFAGTNTSAAAGSTSGMTDKEKAKAARRAFLASRKSVSFAPHAHVRMFDTVVSATPVNSAPLRPLLLLRVHRLKRTRPTRGSISGNSAESRTEKNLLKVNEVPVGDTADRVPSRPLESCPRLFSRKRFPSRTLRRSKVNLSDRAGEARSEGL
jgi:hypothetical protein